MNINSYKLPVCLIGAVIGLSLSPAAHAKNASVYYAEGLRSYQQGDIDQATKQFQAALQEDYRFRPATDMLARINRQRGQSAPESLIGGTERKTLDKLMLTVEFDRTDLSSALEFVRQRAEQESGGKARLNFALMLPPDIAAKKMSLKLNNVPLLDVLHYLGVVYGVDFRQEKYAILVEPHTATSAPAADAAAPAN